MSTSNVVASAVIPDTGGTFRTCQATGRRIHLGAERLIKAHAVARWCRCSSAPSPPC